MEGFGKSRVCLTATMRLCYSSKNSWKASHEQLFLRAVLPFCPRQRLLP
jgi:hypothetical protein